MRIHKTNERTPTPRVSIILLDWSCREWFQALKWLATQDVPRDSYELIWVELFDRVAPEAMAQADLVITCDQKGLYHKHLGYNVALLHARGSIVTVCDSDAVFPPDFVSSVLQAFDSGNAENSRALVLMHHQYRSAALYPSELATFESVHEYKWASLYPNAGACMSVRKDDAITFGGFDEHRSFRGYMCGPYDLGWRLINAGLPEIWHDPRVALYHFAHPDPLASFQQRFSWSRFAETANPHVEGHALEAVQAFSSGRMLPLVENDEIHSQRMTKRRIGSTPEEKYANLESVARLTRLKRLFYRLKLLLQPLRILFERALSAVLRFCLPILRRIVGERWYLALRDWWYERRAKRV